MLRRFIYMVSYFPLCVLAAFYAFPMLIIIYPLYWVITGYTPHYRSNLNCANWDENFRKWLKV